MSNAINSLQAIDISKPSIESLILNTLCRVDKAIICFLKTPVFRIRNGLSSISRMEREKETDILITSLALCKPATQQEITVITADQHVCFLRIDAGNHTCAVNIWWENPAVCFETKNSVWRAMGVWWQWKLTLSYLSSCTETRKPFVLFSDCESLLYLICLFGWRMCYTRGTSSDWPVHFKKWKLSTV